MSRVRPRNLGFERDAIEYAARGMIDPTEILAQMNRRAQTLCGEYVDDPGSVALDRDRPREAREEIEDCLNHAIWWLEDHIGDPRALERQHSLAFLIAFYAAWTD